VYYTPFAYQIHLPVPASTVGVYPGLDDGLDSGNGVDPPDSMIKDGSVLGTPLVHIL